MAVPLTCIVLLAVLWLWYKYCKRRKNTSLLLPVDEFEERKKDKSSNISWGMFDLSEFTGSGWLYKSSLLIRF